MATVQIRPFLRSDRDQLTRLVNRHIAAVMPGASVSVNTVLSQLEREPSEFIVDPWVAERVTLVAEQNGSVAAAALLHRFDDHESVSDSYRGFGEIRWFVFWPMAPEGNPCWQDGRDAAHVLMDTCLAQFDGWGVARPGADGALPHPGVYGVPAQWPHVEQLYEQHGFRHDPGAGSHTETVLMANLDHYLAGAPRREGYEIRRLVGINGTRFEAKLDGETIGYIEVDQPDVSERHRRAPGLADIGNLFVAEAHRRQGIGRWLLHNAMRWLKLGGIDRLLAYTSSAEDAHEVHHTFFRRCGFVELTVTRRGWTRAAGNPRHQRL